jgi:hypothetical protein
MISNFIASKWGIGGVFILFMSASLRLGRIAVRPIVVGDESAWYWTGYAVTGLLFAVGEGFFCIHRRFVPYVVSRAQEVRENKTEEEDHILHLRPAVRNALAPLYCLGFFDESKKNLAKRWGFTALLLAVIFGIHELPPPCRYAIDFGVSLALLGGSVSLLQNL